MKNLYLFHPERDSNREQYEVIVRM